MQHPFSFASSISFSLCGILSLFFAYSAKAETELGNSFKQSANFNLKDINGDGIIEIMAFGDSITRGVGDFFEPGEFIPLIEEAPTTEAGYPLRIEEWLGIPVANRGRPGERISATGVARLASNINNSSVDYVIISEGANDAFSLYDGALLSRDIQSMINITQALGREPMLMTIPPACCGRAGLLPSILNYNVQYRDLATVNRLRLADVERGFNQICPGNKCSLFNLPEGLHPNKKGYDVLGELFAAAFYSIDLFAPGGSAVLAQILGRDESRLNIKSPAAVSAASTERSNMDYTDYNPSDYINSLAAD